MRERYPSLVNVCWCFNSVLKLLKSKYLKAPHYYWNFKVAGSKEINPRRVKHLSRKFSSNYSFKGTVVGFLGIETPKTKCRLYARNRGVY